MAQRPKNRRWFNIICTPKDCEQRPLPYLFERQSAGDQLIIKRGGGLGYSTTTIRAFAAEPNYYFEPFGAVMPDLSHIEVRLLQEERV